MTDNEFLDTIMSICKDNNRVIDGAHRCKNCSLRGILCEPPAIYRIDKNAVLKTVSEYHMLKTADRATVNNVSEWLQNNGFEDASKAIDAKFEL